MRHGNDSTDVESFTDYLNFFELIAALWTQDQLRQDEICDLFDYYLHKKYEGCGPNDPPPHEFRRTMVPVLLDSGDSIFASAYVYSWDIVGKQKIASGNLLMQR